MRKNRKQSRKMSVMTRQTLHVASVAIILFLMAILNCLASSSCQHLMKTIGEQEDVYKKLCDDFERESARWEGLRSTEQIDRALRQHGLNMRYPKADQVVRMSRSGHPVAGQSSVANARRRGAGVEKAAQYKKR